MIAVGIVVGGLAVAHDTRRRGLEPERIYTIGLIVIAGALIGGRAFYMLEHGRLDDPGAWVGTVGFTFYGGFIAAAIGIEYYIRRERLSVSYLDAIAAGLRWASRWGASATSSTASTTVGRRTSSWACATPPRRADAEPGRCLPLRRPL